MPHNNGSISTTEVIPAVETSVFAGYEASRLAVGILAVGNDVMPGRDEEFKAYLRLRANVYAEQTGMLGPEHVREDGTETDGDDSRSVHFGVIENGVRGQRLIGSMRLIIKSTKEDRPLPIEDYFPDTFSEGAAPIGSTEVSRFICRHESSAVQALAKWQLYSKTLAYGITHQLGPVYAVVEPGLERRLTADGVPNVRLAEPKLVPEYNADNLAIVIDTHGLGQVLEARTPGLVAAMSLAETDFTYLGTRRSEPKHSQRIVA